MTDYFSNFNYSLANEDSLVEADLCQGYKTAASVCGAGGRALALLATGIEKLVIFDISETQLIYAQFQYELIRQLNYTEFLTLMGFIDSDSYQRRLLLNKVILSPLVQSFSSQITTRNLKSGLFYSGRWEKYLLKISSLIRRLTFFNYRQLFFAPHFEQQKKIYELKWPHQRFNLVLSVFANPWLMNRILYKGRMARPDQENLIEFLKKNFKNTFLNKDVKKSFFHQMLFLGQVEHREALPYYLQEENYEKIKNFSGKIEFVQSSILNIFEYGQFDFFSSSDVISYLSSDEYELFKNKIEIKFSKNEMKKFVSRSFLKHPTKFEFTNAARSKALENEAYTKDTTGLYQFQILEKSYE